MENKWYLAIIILSLIVLAGIITLLVTTKPTSLSAEETLEECKTISYNGEGKANILFFAEKDVAQKYTDYFLGTQPFNKNQEEFNFFYIDSYKPICTHYKGIALYCYSKTLIKKAASCPHDFVIVVEEDNLKIRSSAYLNVMSINSKHLLSVLTHEFGHAFANLAEEYINNQRPPRGSQNCASDCEDFEGLEEGCFNGCSQTTLYRSIEEGVMRTLNSNRYGPFNENIIQLLIDENKNKNNGITGSAIDSPRNCFEETYTLAGITITENDEVSLTTKEKYIGCDGGQSGGFSQYSYAAKSDTIELSSGPVNPKVITDGYDSETTDIIGESYLDGELEGYIQLPDKTNKLEIFNDKGELVLSEDVSDAGAIPCKLT